jgi:tetratricopeptide (TPR) repeat protein
MMSMPADAAARLSATARRAVSARDWPTVGRCARELLQLDRRGAEGWFLSGLAEKAAGNQQKAAEALSRALHYDAGRYDAAIELAAVHSADVRNPDAKTLLDRYEPDLAKSPYYLHMAATTWTQMGMHARAWPLYQSANALQPGVEKFQASLAACAVLMGRIGEAKSLYLDLLKKHPNHQRNHYELARLERARDRSHVDQMIAVLDATGLSPDRNIFLYYAIAKELEDIGEWDESFRYYKLGGDAAAGVARAAGYRVASDVAVIDCIREVCSGEWLRGEGPDVSGEDPSPAPIFVVGLPRTGTTLTERIIASHSRVESADESFFLQIAVRRASGVQSREDVSTRMIRMAARENPAIIRRHYLSAIGYRLGGKPLFVEKYPLNFLYLGFIARAFPEARIVHLGRHPMDACFAMYKQSFFRFAYTLDDLAEYYIAYDRLSRHWREHLGDRIVEVEYESLVSDPDVRIRELLAGLGLEFEQTCLDFHLNAAPSATASAVQIREKAHTRSVARWKRFEKQLRPLRERLEQAGIRID